MKRHFNKFFLIKKKTVFLKSLGKMIFQTEINIFPEGKYFLIFFCPLFTFAQEEISISDMNIGLLVPPSIGQSICHIS